MNKTSDLTFRGKALQRALELVCSVAISSTNDKFQDVIVRPHNKGISLVSTDRYRIAYAECEREGRLDSTRILDGVRLWEETNNLTMPRNFKFSEVWRSMAYKRRL